MTLQELLATEAQWTQRVSARDAYGHPTKPCGDTAVSWCLTGALDKCYSPAMRHYACARLRVVVSRYRGHSGVTWANDAADTTFADIRRWVEEAEV